MKNPLVSLLARLSVGKKLLLIYLLDLSAVIFISGILINEKYIAINFARDELRGNAYISEVREALLDVSLFGPGRPPPPAAWERHAAALKQAEALHGRDMGSGDLNLEFIASLNKLAQSGDARASGQTLVRGRELVTRIGNQSKLILDPDLDSYYTMSLSVLRYPELVEVWHGIGAELRASAQRGALMQPETRTRFLILEGQLDAVARGIGSDFSEAVTAGGPQVNAALAPGQERLKAALDAYRVAAREALEGKGEAATLTRLAANEAALTEQLRATWRDTTQEMDRLLHARSDSLYARMWWHLGTTAFLLTLLLSAVYFVARQISRPLGRLSGVADQVRKTGDYSLRASWNSQDEIGRLVLGFNEMLGQLDREREIQKELAANARAAAAQQALLEATPTPLVVTAIPGHEVLHANAPAQSWLAGRKNDPWSIGLDPEVRARFFQQLADQEVVNEFEVRWKAGSEPAWAVLSARRLTYQGQDAVLTVFSPINHLKLMETRLELWAKVFEASSEGIMIVNAEERIMTINRAFVRATGWDFHEVIGESPDFLVPDSQPEFFNRLWTQARQKGAWQGELQWRKRQGDLLPVWLMVSTVRNAQGGPAYYICTSIDITDRKKSEERIRFLAHHDVLTELPNRSLCQERLRLALQQAERAGRQVAVLFIDLDRFKDVNDSLGHHVGDELLRSVARRLQEAVRTVDTVSRLAGDEFVIVLNGVDGVDEVARIIDSRLLPGIRQPHRLHDSELEVSCSVGVAMYPEDATQMEELMRLADVAMYHAKSTGRDCAYFFSAEMTERAQRRLQLAGKLRHAVSQGELSLWYQPCVDAKSGRLMGMEGLLRWHNAELGAVEPERFIPIAEENGLIVDLGKWVIEEACRQLGQWQKSELRDLTLSINLSAVQLKGDDLQDTLARAMREYSVPPGRIEIELTETTLMENVDASLERLEAIRALGIGLAIDDFGTGYSSLSYLSRLPIGKLKIDRSFVHGLLSDPGNFAITRSIIGLGHTLGLRVVAEGVELEAEAQVLRASDCDELQGFLFAPPMPAAAFENWQRGHAQRQPLVEPAD